MTVNSSFYQKLLISTQLTSFMEKSDKKVKKSKIRAIVSFICGLTFWIPILNLIFGIGAIYFGVIISATWFINFVIGKFYKNRKYNLKFSDRIKDI